MADYPILSSIFLNQVYLNAHSVKKNELFNYIEVEKTPSLKSEISASPMKNVQVHIDIQKELKICSVSESL
jgi:hypothetical protein